MVDEALLIDGVHLSHNDRVIHVSSDGPLTALSSAVVGAELAHTRHIINMRVKGNYMGRTPSNDLATLARELGIAEPFVGLLTAAALKRVQVNVQREQQATVVSIVTIGLSHPVAAGVTPAFRMEPGTINTILIVDAVLTPAARVNALITATEAKTLALVEAGIRAPHGGPASGTSTDATVIATTDRGARFEYAGPITPVGALIGQGVRQAIQDFIGT